ncbi:MAG TPA: ABC transporter ATP-binding protein [Gemmatimonadaceae bacterium]
MTAGALTLEGLSRRFGSHPAVEDLSLSLAAGELLALVGASGSGKTTTLRMVAGYETPDAGRILLAGADGTTRDITRVPPQGRDFGMVFQHYALFPHMSVGDNVAFGLEARGVPKRVRRERAAAALAAVGLAGATERPVQSLSGGEQQRVALARALVIEPTVLLLDEPLSNLDPTLRRTMRDELRATLRRLGVTALFVTHDQEDAFAVADRVAVIRRGRLLQVGTPEMLYDLPASREVAEFVGRATLLPAAVEDGTARLRVGGREVRVAAARAEGVPAGGEMLAVVRPDALAFAPDGAADGWPAIVTVRRFAGAVVAYHLRTDDGTEMELTSAERGAREGDRVTVRIARAPVAVVPR